MSCHAQRHLWKRRFLLVVSISATGLTTNTVFATGESETTVGRLVRSAQQAELDGDSARHYALLNAAVRMAPDYEAARWQLGQVQVDGKWMAVEEAQRRAAADPKQASYRRLRDEHGDSPEGQLALARWCRSNALDEEARFHWTSVLSIDPHSKEALRALDVRWHDGELRARDEVKQAKKNTGLAKRATRSWTAEVAAWKRQLAKRTDVTPSEILDEIREIHDPQAIPAFERVTIDENVTVIEPRDEGLRQLSLAFLDALDAMPDHKSTVSLVRHAVLSPFSEIRLEATARLRNRPLHDYVPMLLEGLAAPIKTTYEVVADDDGSVHYRYTMYREGAVKDWSHRAARSILQPGSPVGILASLATATAADPENAAASAGIRSSMVSRAGAVRSAQRYGEEAALAEEQIAQTNKATIAMNARIIPVLVDTTDQSLGVEPRAWWDWWNDYTEYYQPDDRPVEETQDYSTEYVAPPMPPQCECFAAGTPVWTKTGQRPIESLQLGELVLAQNVDTGELTYKPIIGRTVRPPSELLTMSFGDDTLRITRGHPVWVAGVGWQMAKELKGGAILHGVTGSPRVGAIAASGQEEAYNLIVAEFNTYFVGKSGVLVHDNTPRQPTRATLPGLVAK